MRVIGGSAKGRPLKGPRPAKSGPAHIRPTSDKVRGALFDLIVGHVEGARVLDLYAGTGALAIEALSRGAASADLVESDRDARRIIAANLEQLGFADRARVWPLTVERALAQLSGQYDVILADPPYADSIASSLLSNLCAHGLLGPATLVAVEHASRFPLPDEVSELHLYKRRRYGDTTLSIYERQNTAHQALCEKSRDTDASQESAS